MIIKDGDLEYNPHTPLDCEHLEGPQDLLTRRAVMVKDPVEDSFWSFDDVKLLVQWFRHKRMFLSWLDTEHTDIIMLVGGHRYDMPKNPKDFEGHVLFCLDIEASFYENEACKKALDIYDGRD